MKEKLEKSFFIAVTGLKKFIDTSSKIVFLGSWCNKSSNTTILKNSQVLTSIWTDSNVEEAYDFVETHYELTLVSLSKTLNELHKVNHSERYWRIVIGPWLFAFISMSFDRYLNLKRVKNEFSEFSTICLADESFVLAYDTKDFFALVDTDAYNLQIFTKIFESLGFTFNKKSLINKSNSVTEIDNLLNIKNIFNFVFFRVMQIFFKSPSVIIRQSAFPLIAKLIISIKSFGKIRFLDFPRLKKISLLKNPSLRDRLMQHKFNSEGEFETLLWKLILEEIPLCFVEGYDNFTRIANQRYGCFPRVIFTSYGWYFDEDFKLWCAAASESGTYLLGDQHGGYYGMMKRFHNESHELAVTDFYYTWGWSIKDTYSRIVPFHSSKLFRHPLLGADNKKFEILYVLTKRPKYLVQFDLTPDNYSLNVQWQHRFIGSLTSRLISALRVRPHTEDSGWEVVQQLKNNFPGLIFDNSSIEFLNSLKRCRLYVTDHFSTTFLEALACNKPTLLFWPNDDLFKEDILPYFDLLRSVGILFDSPEIAANSLVEINIDIEKWWYEPSRQNAVKKFCNQFARQKRWDAKSWVNELLKPRAS